MITYDEVRKISEKIGIAIFDLDRETAQKQVDLLYEEMLERYQISLENKREIESLRLTLDNQYIDMYGGIINQEIKHEKELLGLLSDLSMDINLNIENLGDNLEKWKQ